MYLYTQNKKFWPVLDNALRSAIMRGVDVKLIVAALHNPEISLRFVKSLEALKGLTENATFEAVTFTLFLSVVSCFSVFSKFQRQQTYKKSCSERDELIINFW